jgi:hypothetical protein
MFPVPSEGRRPTPGSPLGLIAGLRAVGLWRLWPWLLPPACHPRSLLCSPSLGSPCFLLGPDPVRLGGPLEVSSRSDPGAGSVQPQPRTINQAQHGCGGWGWQLGQGGEWSGGACPGTCCVSREQCPAASQAGGVLTGAACLAWAPIRGSPAFG